MPFLYFLTGLIATMAVSSYLATQGSRNLRRVVEDIRYALVSAFPDHFDEHTGRYHGPGIMHPLLVSALVGAICVGAAFFIVGDLGYTVLGGIAGAVISVAFAEQSDRNLARAGRWLREEIREARFDRETARIRRERGLDPERSLFGGVPQLREAFGATLVGIVFIFLCEVVLGIPILAMVEEVFANLVSARERRP